jgi:hypothetical protein
MARGDHIFVRQGVYYYHRRAPDRLAERVGQKMIQCSLRTSDKCVAAKRRQVEDVKWPVRFAKAESEIRANNAASVDPPAAKLKRLSEHQALGPAWDHVARMDARSAENYKKDGPASDKERQDVERLRGLTALNSIVSAASRAERRPDRTPIHDMESPQDYRHL